MATPRRILTYMSGSSALQPFWVEKTSSDMSPAAREIPALCQQFQQRLDAAAERVHRIGENRETDVAEQGLGEVEMREQDPVQSKLQGVTQQMVHVVQASNEEKGLIEDEFIAVRLDLELLEVQIWMEKPRLQREVSAVGGQIMIQPAMINEIRHGIMILHSQDNVIIKETGDIFRGIHQQIYDSPKKQTETESTFLNHRRSMMTLQDDVKRINLSNISLASTMEEIKKVIRTLPLKK